MTTALVIAPNTAGAVARAHATTAPVTVSVFPTSLPAAGGFVTLTAAFTAGSLISSCTWSSTPSVAGWSACVVGETSATTSVDVPPNTGASPVTYTFSITGHKLLGGQVVTSTSVTESASASYTYVALGDSFSSGEGNVNHGWVDYNGTVDNTRTANDGCDRSSQAYPELVSTWMKAKSSLKLPSMQLSFLACSGATTSTIWPDSRAVTAGLADGSGNNYNNGESPELNDTAELAHARIVTLSAGGNDVNFSTLVETCLAASYGNSAAGRALDALLATLPGYSSAALLVASQTLCSSSSPVSSVANVISNISKLQPVLSAMYLAIRQEAPHAAIYVMGYPDAIPPPNLLTNSDLANGCGGIRGSLLPFVATITPALDTAIANAATAAGITYVNPNSGPSSFVGTVDHSLCNAGSSYFYAVHSQGTSKSLSALNGSFHPNAAGQAAMASDMETAIASNDTASVQLPPTKSVVSDGNGYCALLTSGKVDCWGYGYYGELGNGQIYASGNEGSAVPVAVVSTSGSGALSGVKSLTSDTLAFGYCALLTSGGVDCWGDGQYGELGNGESSDTYESAVPVEVVSTSGSGTLSGVKSLTFEYDGYVGAYCALLTSGGVDCWGGNNDGELGNGHTGQFYGSAVPVAVVSTSGSGTLSGVESLSSNFSENCALLTSGKVDCWGYGRFGGLGNGQFYTSSSAVPVPVVSTSGSGTLSGVKSLTSDSSGGYCALLTSGGVDCWGGNNDGELGNGHTGGIYGSAVPVAVVSTSGSGTLSGVESLSSNFSENCALLTSGKVDCWGYGGSGDLGNGQFYTTGNEGSAVPVAVVSTSGSGTLSGVTSLSSDGGYCALLTSGKVDCWGYGNDGELGNGQRNDSAVPVAVVSTSGSGTLSGGKSLTSDGGGYCALLTSGKVDCWGYGYYGDLGNGQFNDSAVPVAVG